MHVRIAHSRVVTMNKMIVLFGVISLGLAPAVGYPGSTRATAAGNAADMVNVTMDTSSGTIKLQLDPIRAPATVANFVEYVKAGFYEGTLFHRVIAGFMIQGGGFDEHMTRKETRAPIRNEADNGLKNLAGTIAMARTGDPHSATSQFFINTVDNQGLDYTSSTPQGWGYAVFGKVTSGMDVVHAIERSKTGVVSAVRDVPLQPVVIRKVTVDK
jgi:cyclophilin family peptidyl-prolyl cis-trans isomerase